MKQLLAKAFRKNTASAARRMSTSLSNNQIYPQACLDASNDYRAFNSFRKNRIYNQILEHVPEEQGKAYLELISGHAAILDSMDLFKSNDDYGGPRMYHYPKVGLISPSTLRYVKVLCDLKMHFQTLDGLSICEIGVGYGGQCRVINAYFRPRAYTLIDIQPALALAQRYLDNYILHSALAYRTMNEMAAEQYDLVISNYAFTELPRAVQQVYLERAILKSKRGYITYNEITPPEYNSYKIGELLQIIPGSKRLKEEPLTHPKNCIIIWGANP